jgi:hypothetical protein
LPPVGIPQYGHVQQAERLLLGILYLRRQQNGPGTGSKNRSAAFRKI